MNWLAEALEKLISSSIIYWFVKSHFIVKWLYLQHSVIFCQMHYQLVHFVCGEVAYWGWGSLFLYNMISCASIFRQFTNMNSHCKWNFLLMDNTGWYWQSCIQYFVSLLLYCLFKNLKLHFELLECLTNRASILFVLHIYENLPWYYT